MRPFFKKLRFALIAIGVILVLAIVALHLTDSTSTEVERIRREGFPATVEELAAWHPQVADSNNAALAFLEAAELLVRPSDELNDIGVHTPDRPFSDIHRQLVSVHIASNQLALAKIHRAARLTESKYPVEISVSSFRLPHLAETKNLSWLLSYEVRHWSNTSNRERAVQSLISSLMLVRSMRNEILSGNVVRLAIAKIALGNLEYLLSKQQLTARQLDKLDELLVLLEADNKQASFRSVVGERAYAISSFDYAADNIHLSFGWADSLWDQTRASAYQLLGFSKLDRRIYLDTLRALVSAAEKPFPEAYQLSVVARAEADRRLSSPLGRFALLSSASIPATTRALEAAAIDATHLQCARTAIAIEKYRLDHAGIPPKILAELVPRYLPEPFLDALEGKPLAYTPLKSANGYQLSSPTAATLSKRTSTFTVYR